MHTRTNSEDRRAPGVHRVTLDALVEICGQQPDTPPFEARSVEISGRGMHVTTDFVPALRTPLVLRFEHDQQEVVVEGIVAWRSEDDGVGEFGIRFTALDSKSVVVLKQLCTPPVDREEREAMLPASTQVEPPLFEELPDSATPAPVWCTKPGAPMKLHIEGLAAPMKARVVEGTSRRLRVGSQLEFLTLGRPLQLEDLSTSTRQPASIHSVCIEVDPETQIPQLVVTLRSGPAEDATPEPTVVNARRRAVTFDEDSALDEPTSPGRKRTWAAPPKSRAVAASELDDDEEEDDDLDAAEQLLKGRVAVLALGASRGMKAASERVASVTTGAAQLLQSWVAGRGVKAKGKVRAAAAARSTRVPHAARQGSSRPGSSRSTARATAGSRPAPRQRPQRSVRGGQILIAGIALSCVGLGVFFLRGGGSPEFEDEARLAAHASQPDADDAVANEPAGESEPQTDQAPAVRRKTLSTEGELRPDTHGIVANVPLFGPTQMATTEPAPDGEVAAAPTKPGVDEVSLAKDESFSDKIVAAPKEIQAQREFQVGRMHLPLIHRLRLDTAAESLQGEKTPTGFTVLIPGRKVMESGAGIAGRDDRITNVRVNNTPAGAKVTFRFGKEVPGYKARLRNDYVEFFINSPER